MLTVRLEKLRITRKYAGILKQHPYISETKVGKNMETKTGISEMRQNGVCVRSRYKIL